MMTELEKTAQQKLEGWLKSLHYALEDMKVYFPDGQPIPGQTRDIDADIVLMIAYRYQQHVIEAYAARLAELEG